MSEYGPKTVGHDEARKEFRTNFWLFAGILVAAKTGAKYGLGYTILNTWDVDNKTFEWVAEHDPTGSIVAGPALALEHINSATLNEALTDCLELGLLGAVMTIPRIIYNYNRRDQN